MAAMAKKKSTSFFARLPRWRIWVQATFLLVWLDPLLLRLHSICSPVFHCHSCPLATFACPIGVLANFSALHLFPFIAVGVLAIAGALLGGFICGWVCPFGLFQDLIGRIPTPKFELPRWMGYIRYVTLVALVLTIPYLYGEEHPLFFCRLCPAGALEAAFPNAAQLAIAGAPVVWPTAAKTTIFTVVLVTMLFTWRPWCTVLCPLGAVFSMANWFSLIFVRVNNDECTDCDLCRKLCRYGSGPRQRGVEMDCIRCLDCTKCKSVTIATVFSHDRQPESTEELISIGDNSPSS
jgi:polyferredoxin